MPEISAGRERSLLCGLFFFVLRDWALIKQEFRPKRMLIKDSVKRRNKKTATLRLRFRKNQVTTQAL
ncbi:hypothetical protein DMB90_04330 [Raoultella planticola]|uniref:Uncharacterized protein n=1 Tax=Raoultella planticola TaxID=575 RepID=A0A5P6A993_RAOPL|nr:hypothetical protein DMB90_04330 [Raoultella planticola]